MMTRLLLTRIMAVFLGAALATTIAAGCATHDDAVDAPLMKNAPPPPPRTNKPTLSPSGAGSTNAPR